MDTNWYVLGVIESGLQKSPWPCRARKVGRLSLSFPRQCDLPRQIAAFVLRSSFRVGCRVIVLTLYPKCVLACLVSWMVWLLVESVESKRRYSWVPNGGPNLDGQIVMIWNCMNLVHISQSGVAFLLQDGVLAFCLKFAKCTLRLHLGTFRPLGSQSWSTLLCELVKNDSARFPRCDVIVQPQYKQRSGP